MGDNCKICGKELSGWELDHDGGHTCTRCLKAYTAGLEAAAAQLAKDALQIRQEISAWKTDRELVRTVQALERASDRIRALKQGE